MSKEQSNDCTISIALAAVSKEQCIACTVDISLAAVSKEQSNDCTIDIALTAMSRNSAVTVIVHLLICLEYSHYILTFSCGHNIQFLLITPRTWYDPIIEIIFK